MRDLNSSTSIYPSPIIILLIINKKNRYFMMFHFTGFFTGHTGMLELWDPDEYPVSFMASSMQKTVYF